jgi:predicted GH43/DUF377 family glycosyl hydrolase
MHIDMRSGTATRLAFDARGRLRLARENSAYVTRGELLTEIVQIGPGRTYSIDWIEQWTTPQRYTKYDGNPIYGPDKSGPWDSWTNGVSIVPFDNGTRYRMYYAGKEGEGIGFAEAVVKDPVTWTEHPASPVLTPLSHNWEGNRLNQPRVVPITKDHWRMYYTGWGFQGDGSPWAMGLAESFDSGVTWQRVGTDPLIERGAPGSPDDGGACVPTLLQVGEEWWMWYTAGKVNPAGHRNIHLCFATSNDGVRWEKHPANPVLTDDFTDGAPRSITSRCSVRHDDGLFRMWYSFAKPSYRIHYAESLDGITWERSPTAPVLGPADPPAWDDTIVEYPEVQIVDGIFRLWFCGNGFGSVGYAEGKPESGVSVSIRTGQSPTPDHSWRGWQPVVHNQPLISQGFVQIRAELWSENGMLSPALNQIHLQTPAR